MNLRSKLAVAFAGVGATVAILVGVFSYQTASQRINDELDRSLLTTSAEIAAGATQIVAPSPVTESECRFVMWSWGLGRLNRRGHRYGSLVTSR